MEGILRWPINAEKCLVLWRSRGNDCSNCIKICPFNKQTVRFHNFVKAGVKNLRWSDKLLGDDLFRYGKKKGTASSHNIKDRRNTDIKVLN